MDHVKRRRKLIWKISALGLLVIFCASAYVWFRYTETAASACECGDPYDKPKLAAINPFRDRAPERAANHLMAELQAGHCLSLPTALQYCGAEKRFKITSWKLTGRIPNSGNITMRYYVQRAEQGQHGSFGDPVWITVVRKSSLWEVSNVDLYY
jgi:hypothetical protein